MSTAAMAHVFHDTIVLERAYKASPARVFEAWRSVEARKRWSKPSDEIELIYDKAEFYVGGEDIVRCGTAGDLKYLAKVRYMEIVPDTRIVFSEHVSEGGVSNAAALIDVSFEAKGKETRLVVTMHVAAFDTPAMLQGYRDGWNPSLDKLASEF
jgi:uncharacterized protein YndB with AHSA1/START domain